MENNVDNNSGFRFSSSYYKGKNMIAVISGHHGSGKTWLSISLAQVLSSLKQRVLLFDGSGGLNNVKKQLGIISNQDLDKVIYSGDCLNQIIIPYPKGKFDIILSNPSSSGLATMSLGCLQIFGDDLNIIAQGYDKVILDVDTTESEAARVLIGMSKSIIMVCNDNIASIIECYQNLSELYKQYPHKKIGIVINQVDSDVNGRRAYAELAFACERFLIGIPPLLGIIRDDTRVRDAIRNQTTVITRYPQSEATSDITALAEEMLK